MYSSKSRNTNINEMRYALCCAKKGIESWQLPPCSDSLRKHCLRANYQGAIWRRCLENNPEVPSPVEHGWSRVDQDGDLQLSIDWFNVSIGPQAVLEFLSHARGTVSLHYVSVLVTVVLGFAWFTRIHRLRHCKCICRSW